MSAPSLARRPSASDRRPRWHAYLLLTKPRIIELLLVTTVPSMVLASGGVPDLPLVAATLVGGGLTAASANAFNCYLDRDIDALMRRTHHRPLATADPSMVVSPRAALVFSWVLGVLGTGVLVLWSGLLAALLADAAIAFYVFVYTLGLKRRSSANIVIGGAAGCFPVLVGWAAVTGGLGWPPLVLAAVVFFWTPPHFWALAMRYRDDYSAAGVPMLPVVAEPRVVSSRILGYAVATALTSVLLVPVAGWLYGVCALLLGAWLVLGAWGVHRAVASGGNPQPLQLFHRSNNYLTLLFLAVVVGVLI